METIVSTAPAAPLGGGAGAIATFPSGWSRRAGELRALAQSVAIRRGAQFVSFAVLGALVGVFLLVAAATLPVLVGYHNYNIYGGSMGDGLPAGSIAVAKPVDAASLQVGEIISVEREGVDGGTLHRIISIEVENGQRIGTTQGDANETPDPEPVILSGAGDKVIYHVPYAGYILHYSASRLWQFVLIGAPLVLLAVILLREAWRGPGPAGPTGSRASPDDEAPSLSRVPAPAPPAGRAAALLGARAPTHPQSSRSILRAFLVQQTTWGDQWWEHESISQLITLELLAALKEETGLSVSRNAVFEAWIELDIPFRCAA